MANTPKTIGHIWGKILALVLGAALILGACNSTNPSEDTVVDAPTTTAPAPTTTEAPATTTTEAPTSVYYETCDAARAAGAAPVHRGDPGYGSHLDRDGDGVGCE